MASPARGIRAGGPLTVSPINPRYFTVASGAGAGPEVVYLTGAHVNNNLHDGLGPGRECPPEPEVFDFDAYLELLAGHGHNFVRLWRWEQFRGYLPAADVHFCMTPQPWPRTGPGVAKDGKPKFDLSAFDDAYFERLRDRVTAAGRNGIYVSVMLFEGFSLHLTATPDNIEGHPFCAANNVNGVDIASIVDYQVLPLRPRVEELQRAYLRKVVDTVHDLPNVLYEVANESSGQTADSVTLPGGPEIQTPIGDSTGWQYWVIDVVKGYERERGYDAHPVGMTYLYPVEDQRAANDPLWHGPADWISPGMDDVSSPTGSRWSTDPPANDGTKVVLLDTDHFAPFGCDASWVWKAFLRGHNPLLYDLAILGGGQPADPAAGTPSFDSLEPARLAMGETRRLAEAIGLARMRPRGDLASTGYALAEPGREYLVLRPDDAAATFRVTMAPGGYAVRWYDVAGRKTIDAEPVRVGQAGTVEFRSPFAASSPAVLRLTAVPAET